MLLFVIQRQEKIVKMHNFAYTTVSPTTTTNTKNAVNLVIFVIFRQKNKTFHSFSKAWMKILNIWTELTMWTACNQVCSANENEMNFWRSFKSARNHIFGVYNFEKKKVGKRNPNKTWPNFSVGHFFLSRKSINMKIDDNALNYKVIFACKRIPFLFMPIVYKSKCDHIVCDE